MGGTTIGRSLDRVDKKAAIHMISAWAADIAYEDNPTITRPLSEAHVAHLIAIHSSPSHPRDAAVAVQHHGSWFFIDGRDVASKQAFVMLRTLFGLRVEDRASLQSPVLTVPVSR